LVRALDGIGKNMNIAEGGNWSAENRQTNIDAVVGIIRKAFKKRNSADAALDSWATELENILTQSKTENNLYDLKQGIHTLTAPFEPEPGVIPKLAKTLAAMANHGPGAVGYIIIGATDEKRTADVVKATRGVNPQIFNGFFILGVDHEATSKMY
jgi:hypothetical protein